MKVYEVWRSETKDGYDYRIAKGYYANGTPRNSRIGSRKVGTIEAASQAQAVVMLKNALRNSLEILIR